jgi:hypothetical protein
MARKRKNQLKRAQTDDCAPKAGAAPTGAALPSSRAARGQLPWVDPPTLDSQSPNHLAASMKAHD